jgi:NADH:ubiquinone oxidoreductase subunit 4 (subunit M)
MQGRVLESQYQTEMWVNQTDTLFKWVAALLVVYVICLGIVPAVIVALMNINKKEKITAAAAVPLTASQVSEEIRSNLVSSQEAPQS